MMSDGDFRSLAAGFGDATAMTQLIEAQRSLRRVLLGAVVQAGSTTSAVSDVVTTALQTAWTVLTAADQHRPGVVDAMLAHPYVRVWAVHSLEQLKRTRASRGAKNPSRGARGLAADLGHLGAIAAATAIRAAVKADVTIPVVGAAVHFPTLGRLVVSPGSAARSDDGEPEVASVVVADDAVTVRVGKRHWDIALPDLLAGEPSVAENCQSVSRRARCGRPASAWHSKTPIRTATAINGRQHPG
jgi:uncharacterized protein